MSGKKQAVIVVHGMGEQRPMGTMRTIVDALWTTDVSIELDDPQNRDEDGNKSWIVPDIKTASHDLQRITTPAMRGGRRTDFFEFYYADILDNAKLKNLWRWLMRVIKVKPEFVLERMVWPWTALCFLVVLILWVMLSVLFLGVATQFGIDFWSEAAKQARLSVPGVSFLGALCLILIIMVGARINALRWLLRWPSYALIGLVVYYLIFLTEDLTLRTLVVSLTIVLSISTSLIFLPYLGDVAGYLGAHPDTVGRRHAVRERGLQLLRRLHDDPAYDRIVVVAHSLGSVVAYDILHLLWEELGPTNENPPGQGVREALAAHDDLVRELSEKHGAKRWPAPDLARYRAAQFAVAEAIRQQGPVPHKDGHLRQAYWKITDFITAGSPLSHAQFLLARGATNFGKLKKERLFPTAPPQVFNDDFGVLYSNDPINFAADMPLPKTRTAWAVRAPHAFAHHGAVFSAVRWTNFYDEHHPLFFWQGDVLGGPLSGAGRFGQGICDRNVKISYERFGGPSRFVTHTLYWADTNQKPDQVSANVQGMRDAVNLKGD